MEDKENDIQNDNKDFNFDHVFFGKVPEKKKKGPKPKTEPKPEPKQDKSKAWTDELGVCHNTTNDHYTPEERRLQKEYLWTRSFRRIF